MSTATDATFSTEIFRKDRPNIIAMNRQQATIIGAVLTYNSSGYLAGQLIAQYTSGPNSNLYTKYVSSGASGTGTAVGVLIADCLDAASGSSVLQQLIVKGQLFESKLIGLDSQAKTDLKSRSVYNAAIGSNIFIF